MRDSPAGALIAAVSTWPRSSSAPVVIEPGGRGPEPRRSQQRSPQSHRRSRSRSRPAAGGADRSWFNTTAYALPALGTNGSGGRGSVVGPGYRNVDLGLFRDITLGGRTVLQLGAEGTNVFNIVNLSNPGENVSAPATFGKIRSARDMRRIQLGARLSF